MRSCCSSMLGRSTARPKVDSVTKGSRLRAELSVGGAAGRSRERSLGRSGVRERNRLASPPPTQTRARKSAPTISPSYDHRSSHGNRSIAREDEGDVITEHAGGGQLTGYRFVDIELLTKLWAELGANTVKESRHGLASCFTLECADGETRRFWTSPEADSSKAGPQYTGSWGGSSSSDSGTETAAPGTAGMRVINWMVTAGAMAIGKGATALRTLLGLHCDMPFNCNWDQFYRKCENIVGTAYSRAGAQLADEVGKLLRAPHTAPRAPRSAPRAQRPALRAPHTAFRAPRFALRAAELTRTPHRPRAARRRCKRRCG